MKCEEREVICRDGRAALLRSAHPDDAAEMVRFLLDVCGETEFLLAYPEERQNLTIERERAFLTNIAEDDNELMLTAWVDGQLAGVANINFSTRLKMRHRECRHQHPPRVLESGAGHGAAECAGGCGESAPGSSAGRAGIYRGQPPRTGAVREGRLPRRRRSPGRFRAERRHNAE